VQVSSAAGDPFRDDLCCEFSPYDLISHLELIHSRSPQQHDNSSAAAAAAFGGGLGGGGSSGGGGGLAATVAAFMVSYRVKFPVSLVVSRRALTKYQLLFRHLFFGKHVERALCGTWLDHQATKELLVGGAMTATYRLRQRMLHFMQNLVYYMV
ncbi:unnamed protein product, partial [Phaeothamnion confervicola]